MFNIGDRIIVFYNSEIGEITVLITNSASGFVRGVVENPPENWNQSTDVAWRDVDFSEKVASGTIYAAPPLSGGL